MKVMVPVLVLYMLIFTAASTRDAYAIMQETQIWGTVDAVSETGNALALEVDHAVYATIAWDDSLITGTGSEYIRFGSGTPTYLAMSFQWGTETFTQTDDFNYVSGVYPIARYIDGEMIGLDYAAERWGGPADVVYLWISEFAGGWGMDIWDIDDTGTLVYHLSGSFTSWNTAPQAPIVPEPTTVVLLGIGLVGLAGAEVRRRRKKKAVD